MTTFIKLTKVVSGLEAAGHARKDIGVLLKQLPSAVRRMGLVRSLEWLQSGEKHRRLGQTLFANLSPELLLPPDIHEAVEKLETCPRDELFGYHRRAVALVDQLDLVFRSTEAT